MTVVLAQDTMLLPKIPIKNLEILLKNLENILSIITIMLMQTGYPKQVDIKVQEEEMCSIETLDPLNPEPSLVLYCQSRRKCREWEKKMWLCKDSEAYQELASIVLNTTLQKDLDNMGRFKHTGGMCTQLLALEVFHGSLLPYAPKRQCFSYQSMKQRTNLAIMHHNENLTQKPKLDSEGKPVIIQEWSKRSKEWVTRKRHQQNTVNFRTRLMQLLLERRNDPTVIFKDTSSTLLRPDLPANIGTLPKPSKDDAAQKHKSCFAK
ncbi:uncharacterized protein LOC134100404 [Sardina pilchardus]|uniref:uncharacterized protein LOC134100404 n=1 Tax=Sardina pilchardus TaxID=27697 RepID=UPI002E0E3167